MKFRTFVHYGIAVVVTLIWAITYLWCIYKNQQPPTMIHALMLAVVTHFFTSAAVGDKLDKEIDKQKKDHDDQRHP